MLLLSQYAFNANTPILTAMLKMDYSLCGFIETLAYIHESVN